MPDYRIGALKLEDGDGNVEDVEYFAILPFKGKMRERGVAGLYRIIAAIEKQYAEAHKAKEAADDLDLGWLQEWTLRSAACLLAFERITIEMRDASYLSAQVADALFQERVRVLRSDQDLHAFELDRAARREKLRRREVETVSSEQSNAATPGMK